MHSLSFKKTNKQIKSRILRLPLPKKKKKKITLVWKILKVIHINPNYTYIHIYLHVEKVRRYRDARGCGKKKLKFIAKFLNYLGLLGLVLYSSSNLNFKIIIIIDFMFFFSSIFDVSNIPHLDLNLKNEFILFF